MAHGIIVFGASGSGTTTLGRELAQALRFAHLDIDDYFWKKTDVPFASVRPREERQQMLLADILKHKNFIVSGSVIGWDEPLLPHLDLAVFVITPADIRIDRLKKREFTNFSERISEGGDMYDNHLAFIQWAAKYDTGGSDMRSFASHEQWAKNCPCPVVRVNGTDDCQKIAADIAERFYTKPNEPWRVIPYALGELKTYRFTVIFARLGKVNGAWLYARHKDRDT